MYADDRVVVWIPVYKPDLLLPELLSLWQTTQVLGSYCCILAGRSKDRDFLSKLSRQLPGTIVKLYPDYVFSSVASYCNLLLSPKFYREYRGRHLLVAQLDAWICHADLSSFICYDYIAPLIYPYPYIGPFGVVKSIGVGVGGLSLRRCDAIASALQKGLRFYARNYRRMIFKRFSLKGRLYLCMRQLRFLISNLSSAYPSASPMLTALGCNEDWIIGNFCSNRLRVAPRDVAREFGIDCYYREQMKIIRPRLPLGFHSWWEDTASLSQCRGPILSTLQQGWSEFLAIHGYFFNDDGHMVLDCIMQRLDPPSWI